jgi:hypothetical protein
MRLLLPLPVLLLNAVLQPQADPEAVLVASRMPGIPATAVFALDVATGTHAALSRFPSDHLPPLAIAVDPADREPVVALDDGNGTTIVRLHVRGLQVLGETLLARLPGACTGLTFLPAAVLLVASQDPGGGLHLVPRNGGAATPFWSAPGITALSDPVILPGKVWAAQDLGAQPAIAAFLDTSPGAPVSGPLPLALAGVRLTGVHEFLRGGRVQIVCDDAGRIHESAGIVPPGLTRVLTQPAIVAGGAVAMKAGRDREVFVLGGSVDPTLKALPLVSAQVQRPLTVVGGPFAGDPVDFATTGPATARVVRFGRSCPPAGGAATATGAPQLGNAGFTVGLVQGLPASFALLVLGASDHQYLGVPLPLPFGGCQLLVSIDALLVQSTDPAGTATQPVPVPASPALAGAVFYGQWFQDPAAPRSSDALALQVF